MARADFDWTGYIEQLGEIPLLHELWERELVGELKQWVRPRQELKVLEIGCSNGRWLRWFEQEYSARCFGVDLNIAGASSVRNFVLADGLRLPFGDGVFDVVFSMGLIEHFPKEESRRKLVSEHFRVARPATGIVWLEHPNMDLSLSWLWTKIYYDGLRGFRHYRITSRQMRSFFCEMGAETLNERFLDWFPAIFMHHVREAIHKRFPNLSLAAKDKWCQRKLFEHALTADNFFIVGRRR